MQNSPINICVDCNKESKYASKCSFCTTLYCIPCYVHRIYTNTTTCKKCHKTNQHINFPSGITEHQIITTLMLSISQ